MATRGHGSLGEGAELAKGYIALTCKYSPAMNQIRQDLQGMQTEAERAGQRTGNAISGGISGGARRGTKAATAELQSMHKEASVWGDRIGKVIGASIGYPIGGIVRPARRAFEEVETLAKRSGTAMMAAMTGPMVKMAGAAAGLASIGIGLNKGFQKLVALEDAQAKMESLGMTADQVKDAMKRMNDAIKGTQFSAGEMASSLQKLATSGLQGEELTQWLKDVENVSAVSGHSIEDTTSLLLKFKDEAKLSGMELRKLAMEDLPQLAGWLADYLHVTPEQLADMFKKGEVTSKDAMNAIEAHTKGASERMLHTLGGQSKLLGKSIGDIFAAILAPGGGGVEPMLERINKRLADTASYLEAHGEQIHHAYTNIGHAICNTWHATTNVWHALENTWHACENVWHACTNIWHAVTNFWHACENVWHAFENVWHAVSNVGHASKTFCTAWVFTPPTSTTSRSPGTSLRTAWAESGRAPRILGPPSRRPGISASTSGTPGRMSTSGLPR